LLIPAVLTGVLVDPLTPAVPAVPVAPTWPDAADVLPLMLPAVLGVWLEVLLEGYWLLVALLDVCGGVLLVELDGYWLDGVVLGFEVAVPLMLPVVPAFELELLGLVAVLEEVAVPLCSVELCGMVLAELELCGLLLEDELEGEVVAVELEPDGVVLLVAVALPIGAFADALVPAPLAFTEILSLTLVTPGTALATSFAFLRSALEATLPSRTTTPFFTFACTPLRAGSAAS